MVETLVWVGREPGFGWAENSCTIMNHAAYIYETPGIRLLSFKAGLARGGSSRKRLAGSIRTFQDAPATEG